MNISSTRERKRSIYILPSLSSHHRGSIDEREPFLPLQGLLLPNEKDLLTRRYGSSCPIALVCRRRFPNDILHHLIVVIERNRGIERVHININGIKIEYRWCYLIRYKHRLFQRILQTGTRGR